MVRSILPALTAHIPPGQLGRYLLVGACNTVFAYGTFAIFTYVLGHYIPASYMVASVLSSLGLKKIPEFLVDYSVGDYSGMTHKIKEVAKLFLDGKDAVLTEFENVFDSLLAAKLSTETGRAFIAAKLADAAKLTDPSVVANAPTAGVL